MKNQTAAAAALAIVTACVFANALGVDFVLDDQIDIAGNPSARAASFFDRLPFTNRPLTKASYALNDAAHGLWPAGYAALNLALHIIATIFAFTLVHRALQRSDAQNATLVAGAVAVLWAVHPALTESVTYLSGRSMVFSSALMLAALLAATAERPRPVLAFIAACLAPLARETALVLPLVLLWWQWTVDAGRAGRMRRAMPVWLGTALAALIIALMPRHRDLIAFSLDMRDPLIALRGNLHAATDTLSFWFTPWRVTIFPEPPLAWGWTEWPTLWRIALFSGMAGVALVLRRRLPVVAFGIGLALLALAPSQTFIWRADPVALKPLYIAGLGLTLAIVALAARYVRGPATLVLTIVVALPLALLTVQRNQLFYAETSLFADAVGKTPEYGRAWIAYGAALMNDGDYEEARRALEIGLIYDPADLTAQNLLDLLATLSDVEPHRAQP